MRLDWLGSKRLSWVDLAAFIQHAPQGSAVFRAVAGDSAPWGLSEQLLASVLDVLNMANWQRGGNKNAPRPKPVKRPGGKNQKFGKDAVKLADFKSWWDKH